ncbi:MAG TPA: hypothetical protein DCW41_07030 [Clostridiales bacterium]|nr:hypothetical protein [Clostridiales bacterium]
MNLYAIISLFLFLTFFLLRKDAVRVFQKIGLGKTESVVATASCAAVSASVILVPIMDLRFPRIMAAMYFAFALLTIAAVKFKDRIKVNLKGRGEMIAGLIAVLTVTVTYSLIMSVTSFPIAEGWYTAFAYDMNVNGAVPYRDFELLFTPTYTYFIAAFTKIFGYELIKLRILGVLIFAAIAVLMYFLHSKLFDSYAAGTVCAITAAMYFQASVAQVFYDYIRLMDIAVYITAILLVSFIREYLEGREKKISLKISAAGILTAIGFLVKQNSGAVVIAYVICFLIGLIAISRRRRNLIYNGINYLVSLMIPFLITAAFMASRGIFGLFFEKTTGSAIASKGGMSQVLFGWFPRTLDITVDYLPHCIILTAFIGVCFILDKLGEKEQDEGKIKAAAALFSVCALGSVFVLFKSLTLTERIDKLYGNDQVIYSLFFASIVLFIICFVLVIRNRRSEEKLRFILPFFAVLGLALALNYGVATSGGLSAGQTAMNLGLMIGLVLYLSKGRYGLPAIVTVMTFCIFLVTGIISFKYRMPYAWWSLQEGDVRGATVELEVPLLEGIRVTPGTADGINRIYRGIADNSEEGDNVFIFPHAPVFYTVTERFPETYTLVQWYDVSTDQAVTDDIEVLRNDPPKVIVHIHVPEYVTQNQEANFREDNRRSGLSLMDEALAGMEAEGYVKVDSFSVQGYPVDIYVRR